MEVNNNYGEKKKIEEIKSKVLMYLTTKINI